MDVLTALCWVLIAGTYLLIALGLIDEYAPDLTREQLLALVRGFVTDNGGDR